MDQVGAVLSALASALSPLGVPFVGLVAVVLAAWVGTREAARINAAAQKEIASTNTDSAQEIARINTDNAQKVEQIKAEGQRNLERGKFNREFRRERVRPLLDKLEALRVRNLGAIAAVNSFDTGMAERTVDQIERDATGTEADLRSVCVPELQSLLEALIHADAQWPSPYRQWIGTDIDYRVRLVDSDWKHLLDEAEKARLTLVNTIDAYIYMEHTSEN